MKSIAVVNVAAGSVGGAGLEHMRSALREVGVPDSDVVPLDLGGAEQQFRKLAQSGHDRIVVWGGDGTHRTALCALGQTEKLILLPGGTMNLLSKWIHGEHSWRHILRNVLLTSRMRTLPAGKVGGEYFFCALLAGVPAYLADIREDLRSGRLDRALEDAGAALDVVGRLRLRSREVTQAPTNIEQDVTNVVGAFVGPLSRSGRMDVAALNLPSLFNAVEFAWQSLRAAWHSQAVAPHPAEQLFVDADDDQAIPVILDGESVSLGSSLDIQFVEGAVRCHVAA